jgi:hypothetical protein
MIDLHCLDLFELSNFSSQLAKKFYKKNGYEIAQIDENDSFALMHIDKFLEYATLGGKCFLLRHS